MFQMIDQNYVVCGFIDIFEDRVSQFNREYFSIENHDKTANSLEEVEFQATKFEIFDYPQCNSHTSQINNPALIPPQMDEMAEMLIQQANTYDRIKFLLKMLTKQIKDIGKNCSKQNSDDDHICTSKELNISKKHINKLWSTQIMKALKSSSIENKKSLTNQIRAMSDMVKNSQIKNEVMYTMLNHSPQVNKYLQGYLQNDKILFTIYCDKIKAESKFILIQSYQIFKDAIRNPRDFKSWRMQIRQKQALTSELIRKCGKIQYYAILKILSEQLGNQAIRKEPNKNNITYCWINYIKEITQEEKFKQNYGISLKHYMDQLFENKNKPGHNKINIQSLRHILKIHDIREYLMTSKFADDRMLMDIIQNDNLNLANRYNMVKNYYVFRDAVKDPDSFKRWKADQ